MSEEEEINKLKEVGLTSHRSDVKKKVIDTLSLYGESAIPAITEIVNKSEFSNIKKYGLDAIQKIKK